MWWIRCLVITFAGAGMYGAVIGLWRAPLQACYAGIKLPMLKIAKGIPKERAILIS